VLGPGSPANRIRVGQIGCGRIASAHDLPGVWRTGLADLVALCEVDQRRLTAGAKLIGDFYREAQRPAPMLAVSDDYRHLLAREDVDAVVISVPDHWHAEIAVAAVRAGKDVYLQKPFTMTHAESVLLRGEVAKSGRILQIGSQQRSWGPNEQFRKACEFVRSGRVGRLTRVEIGLPTDPTAPDDPPQPVPANLDYDRWLGGAASAYYTEQRVHSQRVLPDGRPDLDSRPGWLRNESFCLGMITGWGAHHFDIAHWGMDSELTAPTQIEGRGEFPTHAIWNVHGAYHVELTYPGGVRVVASDQQPTGVRFVGDEGWIFVTRDAEGATASDPAAKPSGLQPLDASDAKLLDPHGVTVHFTASTSHHRNWLECVRTRATPLTPAPIAHNANTACILSWIAMKLGRRLTWDDRAGRFVGDAAADALLSRPERAPYGVLRLAG
jgi:predicted dehydrogenase